MLPDYLIAVDLGQTTDYTAIAVAERRVLPTGRQEEVTNLAAYWSGGDGSPPLLRQPQRASHYDLVHLERVPLGTPYTELPGRLRAIEDRVRRRWVELVWERSARAAYADEAPVVTVVDQTGVGRPVVDLLREAGIDPVAITNTGGDQVVRVAPGEWRVPKRNLAGVVQVLLQTRRLRWAKDLAEAATLRAELENFKARISLTGHDSYAAGEDWRENRHDDLVLSVALGCWYGEAGR